MSHKREATGCPCDDSNEKSLTLQPPIKVTKLSKSGEEVFHPRISESEQQQQQQQKCVAEQKKKIEALVSWIGKLGADLSSLQFLPSDDCGGGFGGFAATSIPPYHGMIGRIPNQAIMTVDRSNHSSLIGKAVASTTFLNKQPTPEFVMWLDMCYGRRHKEHFHHLYLVSLPSESPTAFLRKQDSIEALADTNLGIAVQKASEEFKDDYDEWMPSLQKAHPKLFNTGNGFGYEDLEWANGMYTSRRFPPVLLDEGKRKEGCIEENKKPKSNSISPNNEPHETGSNHCNGDCNKNDKIGILLPVLDMFNHAPHQPITWSSSPTHVTFTNSNDKEIPAGSEIHNNYGPKGNEMLMMTYGFALMDNIHDSYGLHLILTTMKTVAQSNDGINAKRSSDKANINSNADGESTTILEKKDLGTFQINRMESPIFPQFPSGLWKALNQMFEEEEDTLNSAVDNCNNSNNSNKDHTQAVESTREEEEEDDPTVEVCPEAVEFLLENLGQRAKPFLATKDKDCLCETNVTRYRNGQRIVLEQAIESLEGMLSMLE